MGLGSGSGMVDYIYVLATDKRFSDEACEFLDSLLNTWGYKEYKTALYFYLLAIFYVLS